MFECSFQRNLVASIVLGLHKKPLKSVNFRGFFLFLVYCGAGFEKTLVLLHNILYANELTVIVHSSFVQCMVLLKIWPYVTLPSKL